MNKEQLIETLGKAGLNLVPNVGGALASIVGDYTSSRKEARHRYVLEERGLTNHGIRQAER